MDEQYYIRLFDKFLQKQATSEEVHLLIQWLKSQQDFNHWADQEWEAVSDQMDSQLQQQLLERIKRKLGQNNFSIKEGGKTENGRKFYFRFTQVAAAILLLLTTTLGIYIYTQRETPSPDMVVSVDKGQKANLVLPDGSKVWINADSKLTYGSQFNKRERILRLEGEAYFEVSPDKKRPFIVQTKDLSVKALGTSFNVKSYKDEQQTSTVLMTGKVEVRSQEECLILNPNEQIVFHKENQRMTKTSVSDANEFSRWRENTLSFQSETFENIAHTLERYYNIKIIFESDAIKKYRFSGTPGNTSLNSILHILSLTSPLLYEVHDSTVILREDMKEKKKHLQMLTK